MGHLAPLRRAWLFKDLRNLQLSPSKPIYAGSRYIIRYSPVRKRNLLLMWLGPTQLRWLLWWRIDQDELNKQVAEYESMRMTRSAKGQSFLLLDLTAWVTTAGIVFAHWSAVGLSEVLIC